LFISIAAVLFTIEAQVLLGMDPTLHPYLFLIFFATMFEYNLHKFMVVFFYKAALTEKKFHWIAQNQVLFYFIFFSSIIGFIISACFAKWSVLVTLFPLGAITFLYSFPVYKKGKTIFRLREVPFIKIFIISIVWSLTSIMLPAVEASVDLKSGNILLMMIERFLFVFAITIPFDIRDMESDGKSGLKTLPLIVGESVSLKLANYALFAFTAMCILHYYIYSYNIDFLLAFLFSGISTLYFINNKWIRNLKHYHYGILDGTMIFQALLVIFFNWLFSIIL
jgi:4-hydroxybenzoate polyprenyltransferase